MVTSPGFHVIFVLANWFFIDPYGNRLANAITVYRNEALFGDDDHFGKTFYRPSWSFSSEETSADENYKYPGETKKPNSPKDSTGFEVTYDESPEFSPEPRDIPKTNYVPKRPKGPYGHYSANFGDDEDDRGYGGDNDAEFMGHSEEDFSDYDETGFESNPPLFVHDLSVPGFKVSSAEPGMVIICSPSLGNFCKKLESDVKHEVENGVGLSQRSFIEPENRFFPLAMLLRPLLTAGKSVLKPVIKTKPSKIPIKETPIRKPHVTNEHKSESKVSVKNDIHVKVDIENEKTTTTEPTTTTTTTTTTPKPTTTEPAEYSE